VGDESRLTVCVRNDAGKAPPDGVDFLSWHNAVVDMMEFRWMRKEETEDNPDWRQVIPTLTVVHSETGRILVASRRSDASESRLSGKETLTFGGHVESGDSPVMPVEGNRLSYWWLGDVTGEALQREISEELPFFKFDPPVDMDFAGVGVIISSRSPVDRAHMALCHVGSYPADAVDPTDTTVGEGDELTSFRWRNPEEMMAEIRCGTSNLESWGVILLGQYLTKLGGYRPWERA
jgi:predicted NUDIX family phosphoesterase